VHDDWEEHNSMTANAPIPSPLSADARNAVGPALQATLVDLVDLSLVGKQAHWNLVGRMFHDVHLHLDELVATARRYADDVAERAAAIGFSPDARARTVAEGSAVPSFPDGWVADRDVVGRTFEAIDAVVSRLRPRIDEAEKNDLVTQDLFIEIVRELEKARWMWRAENVQADTATPG
jgi:starvation-inducible DNA-binding protein